MRRDPARRKNHAPDWLNGHYYANPDYPEHVVRAMFPGGSLMQVNPAPQKH